MYFSKFFHLSWNSFPSDVHLPNGVSTKKKSISCSIISSIANMYPIITNGPVANMSSPNKNATPRNNASILYPDIRFSLLLSYNCLTLVLGTSLYASIFHAPMKSRNDESYSVSVFSDNFWPSSSKSWRNSIISISYCLSSAVSLSILLSMVSSSLLTTIL